MDVSEQMENAAQAAMNAAPEKDTWDAIFAGVMGALKAAPTDIKYQLLHERLAEILRENVAADFETKWPATMPWDQVMKDLGGDLKLAIWCAWAGVITNNPNAQHAGDTP